MLYSEHTSDYYCQEVDAFDTVPDGVEYLEDLLAVIP